MHRTLAFPPDTASTLEAASMRPLVAANAFDVSHDESWMVVVFSFQKCIHVYDIVPGNDTLRLAYTFANPTARYNSHGDSVCVLSDDTCVFAFAGQNLLHHTTRTGKLLRKIAHPPGQALAGRLPIFDMSSCGDMLLVRTTAMMYSLNFVVDVVTNTWIPLDNEFVRKGSLLCANSKFILSPCIDGLLGFPVTMSPAVPCKQFPREDKFFYTLWAQRVWNDRILTLDVNGIITTQHFETAEFGKQLVLSDVRARDRYAMIAKKRLYVMVTRTYKPAVDADMPAVDVELELRVFEPDVLV